MNGPQPRVSIVVMTFNRPDLLRRCLASLSAQRVPRDVFEVVVVDVSDPPVSAIVEAVRSRITVRHLTSPNRGVAGNRNTGAASAMAPWLAFIDDDCVADGEWLARMVVAIDRHPDALIGGGVTPCTPDNAVAQAGQFILDAVDRVNNPDPLSGCFVPGMNMVMPRAGYAGIGGTSEQFGRLAAEDRDFCARWRASGRTIVKAPDARVAHEHRTTVGGFLRQYFNYGRGARLYYQLRARRGADGTRGPAGGHGRLLKELARAFVRVPVARMPKMAALLLAWELANAGGYLYQMVSAAAPMANGEAR
jgi:GT2 family glycosyltransferase